MIITNKLPVLMSSEKIDFLHYPGHRYNFKLRESSYEDYLRGYYFYKFWDLKLYEEQIEALAKVDDFLGGAWTKLFYRIKPKQQPPVNEEFSDGINIFNLTLLEEKKKEVEADDSIIDKEGFIDLLSMNLYNYTQSEIRELNKAILQLLDKTVSWNNTLIYASIHTRFMKWKGMNEESNIYYESIFNVSHLKVFVKKIEKNF